MSLSKLVLLVVLISIALAKRTSDEKKIKEQIVLRQKIARMQHAETGTSPELGLPNTQSVIEMNRPRIKNGRFVDAVDDLGLKTYDRVDVSEDAKQTIYLVIGPEDSGIDYIVNQLVKTIGCVGSASSMQPFDVYNKGGRDSMTAEDWARINFDAFGQNTERCGVIYRSLPHHKKYANIVSMIHKIAREGYRPFLVLTIRSEPGMIYSQHANKMVSSVDEAHTNIHNGLRVAFDAIARTGVDFEVVAYENMRKDGFVRWVYQELGLKEYPAEELWKDRTLDVKIDLKDAAALPINPEPRAKVSNRVPSPSIKVPNGAPSHTQKLVVDEVAGTEEKSEIVQIPAKDPAIAERARRSHGRRAKLLKEKSMRVE